MIVRFVVEFHDIEEDVSLAVLQEHVEIALAEEMPFIEAYVELED